MNFLQIIFKQMRQRALSTWLTGLSVMLGSMLAISVMLLQSQSDRLFGQADYGYDLIIGPKGSKLTLVLNSVYQVEQSDGLILYSKFNRNGLRDLVGGGVDMALPIGVGDQYKGFRIIATTPIAFGLSEGLDKQTGHRLLTPDGKAKPLDPLDDQHSFQYRKGRRFEFQEGHSFDPAKFEAVIGSEVASQAGLKVGSAFKAVHGASAGNEAGHEHHEHWTVVGILKPTYTAFDRILLIPLVSSYAIPDHAKALQQIAPMKLGAPVAPSVIPLRRPAIPTPTTQPAQTQPARIHRHQDPNDTDADDPYELGPDDTIELNTPVDQWLVSAVFVRTQGIAGPSLEYTVNNKSDAMAVRPALIMRDFFKNILGPAILLLLVIFFFVTIVAAVSILVSIYNAVSARMREIAILRALGATRLRILSLICCEAGLIGLIGGLAGLLLAHGIAAIGSGVLQSKIGSSIEWWTTIPFEWVFLLMVVALSVLAGLVPALKAYKTPVATNLAAV